MMKKKDLLFILFWSSVNIVTAQTPVLACLIAIFQHSLVWEKLFKKNIFDAFKLYIIFTTISLEISAFVVGIGNGSIYCYFNVPILHGILALSEISMIFLSLVTYAKRIKTKSNGKFIYRWMSFFMISGILASIISLVINDNNILAFGYYPKVSILEWLNFASRFCLFQATVIFIYVFNRYNELSRVCQELLVCLVFSSVFFAIIGFKGYYGDENIMLSSLAMGFTPCLLLMYDKKYSNTNINKITILAGLVAIVSSFRYPSVIGSKWYLVILFSVVCLIYKYSGIKSSKYLLVFFILFLLLVPLISSFVFEILGSDSYIAFKLNQSFQVLDVAGAESYDDYLAGMGGSPLFRFDEIHNIFIEYTKKPYFAIIGKGFGGTTLHYTDLLPWETYHGAFSVDQVKMNAYYAMHESVATVFLRHGFLGVFFICVLLIRLLKSLIISKWAVLATLFLFFYWSYGGSFSIGVISVILTVYKLDTKQILSQCQR